MRDDVATPPPRGIAGALRRIVFADESSSVCILVESVLDWHGVRVASKADATAVLRELVLNPDDASPIVISDSLRDMSGRELVRRIRAMERNRHWIVLTVTRDQLHEREALRECGVDSILIRPYSHVDLLLAAGGATDQ